MSGNHRLRIGLAIAPLLGGGWAGAAPGLTDAAAGRPAHDVPRIMCPDPEQSGNGLGCRGEDGYVDDELCVVRDAVPVPVLKVEPCKSPSQIRDSPVPDNSTSCGSPPSVHNDTFVAGNPTRHQNSRSSIVAPAAG